MADDADREAVDEGHEERDERDYEVERTMTRDEAATLLRKLADDLESGSVAFYEGGIVADIPGSVDLEIEFEREDGETEIEIELEWPVDDGGDEGDEDGEDGQEAEGDEEDEREAAEKEDKSEADEDGERDG